MPKESKFYFVPLRKKFKIENENHVSITKAGMLVIPRATVINMGLSQEKLFIELFCDTDNRTLGFKFPDKVNDAQLDKENVRLLNPNKAPKGNSFWYQTSVRPFIKTLLDAELPASKIAIETYMDSLMGEMMYVTIPKQKKIKE